MYSVSEDFITAIQSNVRRTRIKGFIGDVKIFDEDNIVKDSLKIESALWSRDISFGNMQCAKLSVTLVGDNSILIGDEISIEWGIETQSEPISHYEWLPLGVFNVFDIAKKGAITQIVAYDNMYKFEQDFILPEVHSQNIYNWLVYTCEQCGVVFGMAEEEVKNLPNYSAYSVPDGEVTTYRQLISYIAMITGSNAIINRNGELVLIQLKQKDAVYVLPPSQIVRDRTEISELSVKICGVYIATPDGETYGSDNEKDGKVIEFERIPIIEDEVQNYPTIADNILSVASTLSFTPFEIEWQGNPALDIGDVITLPNGNDSIITSRVFKFKNTEKISAIGDLEKASVVKSASPQQNAQNIINIYKRLQNYATKDDVNNAVGMYATNTIHFAETMSGFDLTIAGGVNHFLVEKDELGRIIKITNQTLNYVVWEGTYLE